MPLVSYSGSEDSDSDGEEVQAPQLRSTTSAAADGPARPSTSIADNGPSQQSSAIDRLISKKKSGSSLIQITAPSLAELEDTSSDEDEPKVKRSKQSSTGSGLSSMLPKPRSAPLEPRGIPSVSTTLPSAPIKTTLTQLVPDTLRLKKPAGLPPPKSLTAKPKTDDDDGPEISSFFTMPGTSNAADEEPEEEPTPSVSLPSVQIAPRLDSDPPIVHSYGPSSSSTQSQRADPNDLSFRKKVAARFGDETADQIHIVDVNVSDHLFQNKEYLKTISLERDQEVTGEQPNATAKRKHQITYLAYQAKQRELALKNEWAASKVAKNQTRAKYGF